MDKYELDICGLRRELPIIQIEEDLAIASFVILGDTELLTRAAPELASRLPEFDLLISAEAKGIPLIHEVARFFDMNYIVARKSVKAYMRDPLVVEVDSVTTREKQVLCLDRCNADKIAGKKVAIIDDVVSTGASMEAVETLVQQAGGEVAARAALLAEGQARGREDIIYLEELPLFDGEGRPLE